MSIEMDVTKMIINEKLKEEESFSLDELLKDISSQGGSNYVAEDLTVKQYLDTLKEVGLLAYNPSTNRYAVLKNPNSKN
ncbi:MAG: hypothetical protein BWY36_00723 [Candidatus Diapherotrites archaeon ADurb.Bin253]|jgi:hypothetical protein|nr:hypothetical protein [Candidatus Pacearchaeota archaeon]OQA67310.1 MAG: hypothetical protein BWY36_00723 [Candidatus Diapherotrites archaeon ADurb.Bin253]HNZ51815.1 hypothetical protein [Candidatus Pacearchaeota archaeon]HOC97140.1 hypothetical protein [Candidatus Pacearchaeota archaeon]HOF44407.1 hypothetical protein [Candidatus Pacearchaeota archaeon]